MGTATLFHLVVFVTWFAVASLQSTPDAALPDGRVQFLPPPPPIDRIREMAKDVIQKEPPRDFGVPEPVEEFIAPVTQFPTNDEIAIRYDEMIDGSIPTDGSVGGFIVPPAADPSTEPVDFHAVEVQPQLVDLPAPSYPEMARLAEVEGTVLLQVLVGKDGRVKEVRVVQSVPMLDSAAIAAASRAVFTPARQQGRPVSVWVEVPIRFRLS
jgi:protein TonB